MALPRAVRSWLLGADADPSVRWTVLRELLGRDATDREVVAARREIGRTGWAASILAEQLSGGQWATPETTAPALYRPKYIATNWRLLVLADLGTPVTEPRLARGLRLFLRRYGGPRGDLGGRSSEHCFTGNAARMLLEFGYPVDEPHLARCLAWLIRTQKPDGGWHCFPSRRGTLDAWEGLSAFARVPAADRTGALARSIERGAEFFLARGLLREGRPYAPWIRLHYPVHYYYDLLVGLDILTRLGYSDDRRMRAPLDRLEAMRRPDGRWALDAAHPDTESDAWGPRPPYYSFQLERPGFPSRWITATALSVLRRAGRA